MNAELKTKWLEALRSGQYKQARDFLCVVHDDQSKSYCCLGVLSDIMEPNYWDNPITARARDGDTPLIVKPHSGSICFPGSMILSEAGLSKDVKYLLSDMNDEQKKSFEEIADWIEKKL